MIINFIPENLEGDLFSLLSNEVVSSKSRMKLKKFVTDIAPAYYPKNHSEVDLNGNLVEYIDIISKEKAMLLRIKKNEFPIELLKELL